MLRGQYDACIYAVENGGMLQTKVTIMQVSCTRFHTQRGRNNLVKVVLYAILLCMHPYHLDALRYIHHSHVFCKLCT